MLKFWKFWGNDVIEFYCHPSLKGVIPEPRPAVKNFPNWFTSLPSEDPNERDMFNTPTMTAKKCFPLLDAMSLGFSIPLCGDVHVITDDDNNTIECRDPPGLHLVEFHSLSQVGGRTAPGYPLPPVKFINHWVIKTAPGWSTLFVPPLNHFNTHFTCLSGLVDTDNYPKEVNFPAVWHTPGFDGVVRSGTYLVTAIPIKRNSFNKKPKIRDMNQDEFKLIGNLTTQQNIRKHVYTEELRAKK